MRLRILVLIIVLIGLPATLGFIIQSLNLQESDLLIPVAAPSPVITSFSECEAAQYPIMESYPRQCRGPYGETYTEIIEPQTAPAETTLTNIQAFDEPFALEKGNVVSFSDGLTLTVEELNDSRCPIDVECITAGEITATISVTGGSLKTVTNVVNIGTGAGTPLMLSNYLFSISLATDDILSFEVGKTESTPDLD